MPIYEYRCTACHRRIEVLQKINDPPLVDCTECGCPSLEKQISAASFRLKGSGWYETDFKGGKKKNIHGESAEGASKPSADVATADKKVQPKASSVMADSKPNQQASACS